MRKFFVDIYAINQNTVAEQQQYDKPLALI